MTHFVNVNGTPTIETIGVCAQIDEARLELYALQPPANREEELYYLRIEQEVALVAPVDSFDTTRKTVAVFPQRGNSVDECITAIQLLLGRGDDNTMVVFQRSSNTDLVRSDLGFLARLALDYGCTKLVWLVGSLHTGVE